MDFPPRNDSWAALLRGATRGALYALRGDALEPLPPPPPLLLPPRDCVRRRRDDSGAVADAATPDGSADVLRGRRRAAQSAPTPSPSDAAAFTSSTQVDADSSNDYGAAGLDQDGEYSYYEHGGNHGGDDGRDAATGGTPAVERISQMRQARDDGAPSRTTAAPQPFGGASSRPPRAPRRAPAPASAARPAAAGSTQQAQMDRWAGQRAPLAINLWSRRGNNADVPPRSESDGPPSTCNACHSADAHRVRCTECGTRCAECDRVRHAHERTLRHVRRRSTDGTELQPGVFIDPNTGTAYHDGLHWDLRPHYCCAACGGFDWVAQYPAPPMLTPLGVDGGARPRRRFRGFTERGIVSLVAPTAVSCGRCGTSLHDEHGRYTRIEHAASFSVIDLTRWWPLSPEKVSMVLHVPLLLQMLALQQQRNNIGFSGLQDVMHRLASLLSGAAWAADGDAATVARRQSAQLAFAEFRYALYEQRRLQGRELTRCVRCSPAGGDGSVKTASVDGNAKLYRFHSEGGAPASSAYFNDVMVPNGVADVHSRTFPAPVEEKERRAAAAAADVDDAAVAGDGDADDAGGSRHGRSRRGRRGGRGGGAVIASVSAAPAPPAAHCINIKAARDTHGKRNPALDEHGCAGVSCRCGIILALLRQYRHENRGHMSFLCSHVLMPLGTTQLCTDSGCRWWDTWRDEHAANADALCRAHSDADAASVTGANAAEAEAAVTAAWSRGDTSAYFVAVASLRAASASSTAAAGAARLSARRFEQVRAAAPAHRRPGGHPVDAAAAAAVASSAVPAAAAAAAPALPALQPLHTASSPLPLPTVCPCTRCGHHLFAAPLDPTSPSRLIPGLINHRSSMLHGLVHIPSCRWRFMSLYTPGVGWWHGEELEHAWALLSPAGRLIRGCSSAVYADNLSASVHALNYAKNERAHVIAATQLRDALERAQSTAAALAATLGDADAAWATEVERAAAVAAAVDGARARRRALAAAALATLRTGNAVAPGEHAAVVDDDALVHSLIAAREELAAAERALRLHAPLRDYPAYREHVLPLIAAALPGGKLPTAQADGERVASAKAAVAAAATAVAARPAAHASDNDAGRAAILARRELRTVVLEHAAKCGQREFQRAEVREAADSNASRKFLRGRGAPHLDRKIPKLEARIRLLLPACGPAFANVRLPPAGREYDDADLAALEAAAWHGVHGATGAAAAAQQRAHFVTLSAKCDRANEEVAIVAQGLVAILRHHVTRREQLAARVRELLCDARVLALDCSNAAASRPTGARELSAAAALPAQSLSCDAAVPTAGASPLGVLALRVMYTSPWAVQATGGPRFVPNVGETRRTLGPRAALRLLRGLAVDAHEGYRRSSREVDDVRAVIAGAYRDLVCADAATADAADATAVAAALRDAVVAVVPDWDHPWADAAPAPPRRKRPPIPTAAAAGHGTHAVNIVVLPEFMELLGVVKRSLAPTADGATASVEPIDTPNTEYPRASAAAGDSSGDGVRRVAGDLVSHDDEAEAVLGASVDADSYLYADDAVPAEGAGIAAVLSGFGGFEADADEDVRHDAEATAPSGGCGCDACMG